MKLEGDPGGALPWRGELFCHPRVRTWPVLPTHLAQGQLWVWRVLRDISQGPCPVVCVVLAPLPFLDSVSLPNSEGTGALKPEPCQASVAQLVRRCPTKQEVTVSTLSSGHVPGLLVPSQVQGV